MYYIIILNQDLLTLVMLATFCQQTIEAEEWRMCVILRSQWAIPRTSYTAHQRGLRPSIKCLQVSVSTPAGVSWWCILHIDLWKANE